MSDDIYLEAPCPNCMNTINNTMEYCPVCGYQINQPGDVEDAT